jgi:hypothetical protein
VNSEVCLVDQLMQEIRSGTFKLRRSEGWLFQLEILAEEITFNRYTHYQWIERG